MIREYGKIWMKNSDIDIHAEWYIPSTEDSAGHILNALNDDCIVFRKLKDLRDIFSVATDCTRFQSNAITIFQ